jgi:GAF domain-containing protein
MVHADRPAPPAAPSTAPSRRTPPPSLQQVLQHARQAFVCDAASILTLAPQGRGQVLGASETRAAQADRLQLEHGEGPAIRVTGDETEVHLSGDAQADPRWSRWGRSLVELGWSSVLSTPLVTSEHTLGMLTLYARRPAAFDATHAYAARIFAHYATTALAGAREAAELTEAIRTRHRVNLAQGVLMELHGLDAEGAFALMRRAAEEQQVKLGAVADQVLAGQSLPAPVRSRR